jgi:hypothetical protein
MTIARLQSAALGAAALCALSACAVTRPRPAPVPLNHAWSIATPALYANWWAETERCSGHSGSLEAVQFFAVAAWNGQIYLGSQRAEAWWVRRGNRIYLPDGELLREDLVRHEMLHALTRSADHPIELFEQRCHVTTAARDGGSAGADQAGMASERVWP